MDHADELEGHDEEERRPNEDDSPEDVEGRLQGLGASWQPTHPQVDGLYIPCEGDAALGGQAVVKRVRVNRTGQWVALKHPHVLTDLPRAEEARARCLREAQLLSALVHPNIPAFRGRGWLEDGRPYLLMDWIDGRELNEFPIESPVESILRVFHGVLSAMSHCHRRGVLHRDIKPSNIRVCLGGRGHLIDFGVSKALQSQSADFETAEGSFAGTRQYSAPEVSQWGTDHATRASDVFAMGKVLAEWTGKLKRVGAYGQWERLLGYATAKDARYRYKDGAELYWAFLQWRAGSIVPEPNSMRRWGQFLSMGRWAAAAIMMFFLLGDSWAGPRQRVWVLNPPDFRRELTAEQQDALVRVLRPPTLGQFYEIELEDLSLCPFPLGSIAEELQGIESGLIAIDGELGPHERGQRAQALCNELERLLITSPEMADCEAFLTLRIRSYLASLDSYWVERRGMWSGALRIERVSNQELSTRAIEPLRRDLETLRNMEGVGAGSVRYLELETRFLCALSRVTVTKGLVGPGKVPSQLSAKDLARLGQCLERLDEFVAPPLALKALAEAHYFIQLSSLDLTGPRLAHIGLDRSIELTNKVLRAIQLLQEGERNLDLLFLERLLGQVRLEQFLVRATGGLANQLVSTFKPPWWVDMTGRRKLADSP